MNLSDKTVREICSCAQFRNLHRGDAVFCEEAKGGNPPSGIQFMDVNKGEVCLGTSFYSTGHSSMDSSVDVEEMKKCPYKKSSK
ncbi:MAG: hypothetical protein PHQ66_03025 [Candidatus Nanoarchaeia archaeon]|nr:hypothetical protein [Candidatus Nanoarchaeia archaeon]MDD5357661.1 hypothetical protein [Candidatus Nanoarchaeia archaeon]MDD5588580.1 hypothetical protein [Candidatus Nanoarchaeia archaeon]